MPPENRRRARDVVQRDADGLDAKPGLNGGRVERERACSHLRREGGMIALEAGEEFFSALPALLNRLGTNKITH